MTHPQQLLKVRSIGAFARVHELQIYVKDMMMVPLGDWPS
jgi:hypothetical protein